MCQYGVHIPGYVRHSSLGLCVWFQRRSDTKQTWPGMWDSFVGGGLTEGYGVTETAVKARLSIRDHLPDLTQHTTTPTANTTTTTTATTTTQHNNTVKTIKFMSYDCSCSIATYDSPELRRHGKRPMSQVTSVIS